MVEKLDFFVIIYFDTIFIYTKSGKKEYIKAI